MNKSYFVIAATVVLVSSLSAHDPGTHMYIGSQTFDLWQDYDPEFYQYLLLPDTHHLGVWGMMTRKFYYNSLGRNDSQRHAALERTGRLQEV